MAKAMWDLSMAEQWKFYKPPVRPSEADLAIFGKYIEEKIAQKGKDIKILILGSTPELRSLVHTFGLPVWVCDYSEENFRALGQLVAVQGVEHYVQQNWITLDLDERFDLIFGEASPNVVAREDVPAVLRNAERHLAEGGLFLAKVWYHLPQKDSLPEILKRYREEFLGEDFYHAMAVRLYTLCHDPKTDATALFDVRLLLEKYHKQGVVTTEELKSCTNIINEKTKLRIFGPLRTDWDKIFVENFDIIRVHEPAPIGPDPIPIYALRKK